VILNHEFYKEAVEKQLLEKKGGYWRCSEHCTPNKDIFLRRITFSTLLINIDDWSDS
jgi:hypothetical protein